MQTLAFADEERNAQVFFELTNARRHVGLDTVQPFRGTRHAAFVHDGTEDAQVGQIHTSLLKMNMIFIIHSFGLSPVTSRDGDIHRYFRRGGFCPTRRRRNLATYLSVTGLEGSAD